MSNKIRRYVAEPDPSFCDSDPGSTPWRVRTWKYGDAPWTLGHGMTETEARACERALSELPGVEPVDEVARRRVECAMVSLVSGVTVSEDGRRHDLAFERPSGQASSAPFVPYSPEDVASVREVAQMFLDRKLAPSAALTEALARAVITLAEDVGRMR